MQLALQAEVERKPVFPPVRDADGWIPVNGQQSVEEIAAFFRAAYRDRRARVLELFKATVAELREGEGWDDLAERQKYCRILAAMGFRAKAERAQECHDFGIPGECVACGLQYASRYHCTLRFCVHCARWHFARLMSQYAGPIAEKICSLGGWNRTLAMLTFTVRSDGEMPHPDKAKWLMRCVRSWFKRMVPQGETFGAIFAAETGYELPVKHPGRKAGGWNLHVHALYFGPYLDFGRKGERGGRAGELWREVTAGEGEVLGIKQCPGWRLDARTAVAKALAHHFGYILKPAADSGERLAALEVLFSGVRRVHGIGIFYRLPKPERKVSVRCPRCGSGLPVNLRAWHRSERKPMAWLEEEGFFDLAELRRAFSLGGGGP